MHSEMNDCVTDWVSVRFYGFIADKVFTQLHKTLSSVQLERVRDSVHEIFQRNFPTYTEVRAELHPPNRQNISRAQASRPVDFSLSIASSGKFNANCDPSTVVEREVFHQNSDIIRTQRRLQSRANRNFPLFTFESVVRRRCDWS